MRQDTIPNIFSNDYHPTFYGSEEVELEYYLKRDRDLKYLQTVWTEWLIERLIDKYPDKQWCHVTLSLKPRISLEAGKAKRISRTDISKTVSEFLKRLNKYIYKNAYRRYGKSLLYAVVKEQNADKNRWHLHMILEIPKEYIDQVDKYEALVEGLSLQLRWFENGEHAQHLVQKIETPERARGWIAYIMKKYDDEKLDIFNLEIYDELRPRKK